MLVYRYVSEYELRNILQNNVENLGFEYNGSYGLSNNHKYKKGVKYLHFFKHKSAINFIRLYHTKENCRHFVCTFDIPYLLLFKGMGKGRYELSGMDYLTTTEREYIVPANEFKKEWLKSYVTEQYFLDSQQAGRWFLPKFLLRLR